MKHLNMMKMVGLVVLLMIALMLPSVLPRADAIQNGQAQRLVSNIHMKGLI